MFVGDSRQGGCQNDDRQTDQSDFCQMQGQRNYQPDANNSLDNQFDFVLAGTLLAALIVKLLQDITNGLRQRFAIAKPAQFLDQYTG